MLPFDLKKHLPWEVHSIINIMLEINPNFQMADLHQAVWATAREHEIMPDFVQVYSTTAFKLAEEFLIEKFPELNAASFYHYVKGRDVLFTINSKAIHSMDDISTVLDEISESYQQLRG